LKSERKNRKPDPLQIAKFGLCIYAKKGYTSDSRFTVKKELMFLFMHVNYQRKNFGYGRINQTYFNFTKEPHAPIQAIGSLE
jgi:hypothetical protein